MNKKHVIIIAAAAIFCFAATFGFSWLMQKPAPQSAEAKSQTNESFEEPQLQQQLQQPADSAAKRELAEKQLKSLFYDVKEKIREYDGRMQDLDNKEKRLVMAQDSLKKDIEKLDNLRTEVASMITSLKQQQEKINNSLVKIDQAEKSNLVTIAATYDKMDPASAGQILTNLTKIPAADSQTGSGLDEAVKILFYMNERARAKVLAELVGTEPALAAVFCDKLKRINEVQ
jgi:flagellar motility protein MotE (MotC chaperone)